MYFSVRFRILAMLGAVSAISYLERVAISIVSPLVMQELHLTQPEMGRVFSAFMLGYALCQYPSGSLADRFGTKTVLGSAMLSWGVLTLLTGCVEQPFFAGLWGSVNLLLGVRFLLGVTEAPTYPASARVVSSWFSKAQQGKATSIFSVGVGAGSAIAPPLVGRLMLAWGWKVALWIVSVPAFLMALVWFWKGEEGPRLKSPREEVFPSVVETSAIRSGQTWLLTISYFLTNYIFYVFVFWFFPYLVQVRHLSIVESSWIATAPWLLTIVVAPVGGGISDFLVPRIGEKWGRRLVPLVGLILAGILLSVGARAENPYLAVVGLTLCEGLVILVDPVFWASAIRLAPGSSGRTSGLMNMGGNLGGLISASLTPIVAARFGWVGSLDFSAVLASAGGILWLWADPGAKTTQRVRGNTGVDDHSG